MEKTFILLAACLAFFISSCQDDSEPTNPIEEISGITYTNRDGIINGEIDPSDWCIAKTDTTDGILGPPRYLSFGPAYPNPSEGGFRINFSLSKMVRVKLSIVNSEYEVKRTLYDNEELMPGSYIFSIPEAKDWPEGMYRVYFETDSLKCKGDILLDRL